jgi:hypothetical protein
MPVTETPEGDNYTAGRDQRFVSAVPGEPSPDPLPADEAAPDSDEVEGGSSAGPERTTVIQHVTAGRNAATFGRDGVVINRNRD